MPFNIHVGDHDGNNVPDQPSVFSTPAFRAVIKLGGLTALVIAVINLVIFATGESFFEWSHMFIFLLLFVAIAYGMHPSRSWISEADSFQDRMAFGMLVSAAVAFFLMIINGVLGLLDYHLIVSEVFLPINSAPRFAVSSMALFLSCLAFGFLSTLIVNFIYKAN